MIDILEKMPIRYIYPELTRFDIINHFIKMNGYKSYLEIGVQNGECFKNVKCELKQSVDPDKEARATFPVTSDKFFQNNKRIYDIIFIDGLHHSDQVYKDIDNSLDILSENGTIICHDCLPFCEETQRVPRETKQWTGDVWKGVLKAKNDFKIALQTVDTDLGVGIIKKSDNDNENIEDSLLTYQNFVKFKHVWLNIISVDEFNKIYDRIC